MAKIHLYEGPVDLNDGHHTRESFRRAGLLALLKPAAVTAPTEDDMTTGTADESYVTTDQVAAIVEPMPRRTRAMAAGISQIVGVRVELV